jgi:glucuronate isomerase
MNFIKENFLLKNNSALNLYNKYAKNQPIIDYHCHISPKEIAEDKVYENLTQIWLYGDHYKWRAMRINGIDELYITGNGSDYEKFFAFAQFMPKLIGNPIYHWCHLELKRYFDIDLILNEQNALQIWDICNEKLKELSVKKIIEMSNVKVICSTDDPIDSLEYHKVIKADKGFQTKVFPTFRPDKAINIENDGFLDYIKEIELACNAQIKDIYSLKQFLLSRIEYFNENGCKTCDHGLGYIPFEQCDEEAANKIFLKVLDGEGVSKVEADKFKTDLLLFLGKEYYKKGWVMELHFGVARNINAKKFSLLGADTGFDCIGGFNIGGLHEFLNNLEKSDSLPKTIIYSINPSDNAIINTICGCFQGGCIKGKVQQGSAWWFNDTKEGMENQLKSFGSLSSLGSFVGMLTDSRSFLSYTRHEYFRRILCNYIGGLIEDGEYPVCDEIGKIIEDICFNNAREYFGFEV